MAPQPPKHKTPHRPSRQQGRRDYDQQRRKDKPWRAWYGTARWQTLAKAIYARDLNICQVTGEMLTGEHPAPNSPVAHHIKPHRGDPALFWDPDNIQTVSKRHHDSEEQAMEKSGKPRRQSVGADGWPV